MATTISMPQLGETVTEGTILRWAKQVGDSVSEDDVLVEISTDKVDTEVPSPASGVILEILVAEGETVPVGAGLVVIGDRDEATVPTGSSSPSEPETQIVESVDPVTTGEGDAVKEQAVDSDAQDSQEHGGQEPQEGGAGLFLSPVVRRLAREHGVDVSQMVGTGRGGRVTRDDILAVIDGQADSPPAAPSVDSGEVDSEGTAEPVGEVLRPAPEPVVPELPPAEGEPTHSEPEEDQPAKIHFDNNEVPPAPPTQPAPAELPASEAQVAEAEVQADRSESEASPVVASRMGDEVRELDRLRAAIGRNMIKAKQTAAHVWTSVEVDFESVERVRQAHREQWKAEEGFSLTYLPFIARATLDALRAYPVVNSSFYLEDNKAVFHHNINLGVAVDLNQKGLVVTSIRDADDLTMRGIARAIRALADKARAGKLGPDDISGSTFTITNPGPFGSFMSAPIINVPNVAILSTDTVTKRAAVVTTADGQDTIAIRHIGYLGLSWDHRALDGSTAVLFLRRIKENLESWDWEQQVI